MQPSRRRPADPWARAGEGQRVLSHAGNERARFAVLRGEGGAPGGNTRSGKHSPTDAQTVIYRCPRGVWRQGQLWGATQGGAREAWVLPEGEDTLLAVGWERIEAYDPWKVNTRVGALTASPRRSKIGDRVVVPLSLRPQVEELTRWAFRAKANTKVRRELAPQAEVDEYGFLREALPSVTWSDGPLLDLLREVLTPVGAGDIDRVTINYNYQCPPHVDKNASWSWLLTFGDYTGGELEVGEQGEVVKVLAGPGGPQRRRASSSSACRPRNGTARRAPSSEFCTPFAAPRPAAPSFRRCATRNGPRTPPAARFPRTLARRARGTRW